MANINITKNTPDTADNVARYRDDTAPVVDYGGITILVGGILILLTIVWLIILAVAGIGCWWNNQYECSASNTIFWGYVSMIGAVFIVALLSGIFLIGQRIVNISYFRWRGVVTHRDDLRNNAGAIIAVAHASAESEASAGIDNYSPSFARTITYPTPAPAIEEPSLEDDTGDIPMEVFIAEANK